eukprot:56800-Pyramimonas_sp.AAC.1
MVEEAYRCGWFQLPGATRIAVTFTGTRPRTPFGDALFLFIIAEVTNNIASGIKEIGLTFFLAVPSANMCEDSPAAGAEAMFPGMVYADDSLHALLAPLSVIEDSLGDFCRIAVHSHARVGLVLHLKI